MLKPISQITFDGIHWESFQVKYTYWTYIIYTSNHSNILNILYMLYVVNKYQLVDQVENYNIICFLSSVLVHSLHILICHIIQIIHGSRPQSNMLKICLQYFWEFPKIFTYYALHASHYACIMLQYEQYWCKNYCLFY